MRLPLAAAAVLVPALLLATPPDAPPPAAPPAVTEPVLPDGGAKAAQTAAGFRMPKGLKAEVFAAEPRLSSPVAISVDDKGRVYAAEEYRLGQGAAENRNNPAFQFSFFLDDDLQIRTPADRLAAYKKWQHKLPGGMGWFTKHADQVRRIEDTDGDGKADKSTVFAGGFNHPLDGLAAGVLAKDGDVYFTCIPNLWKLRDADGDGVADTREALLTGFGPNIAFFGHDLHGLIVGPDGKLYFSVGDRGFQVTSKEGKQFDGPRTGAVFRCDPDGTNFEVVMRGLRNPQELAFDQYGNLFADDNNCDKGDHARLVYIVEDGDSGWNMAYQTIPKPYEGGPWFAEKMWHLPHAGQPAWVVPPAGKIGTGPAGFLFTSGTTLPERYKNSFIMCNYAGGRGLEAFKVVPKGAGFEIKDYHDFLTPVMATDAEFGPDGKLYVADFVNLDWGGKSLGGRVFAVADPEKVNSTDVLEMKRLFAEGFGKQKTEDLLRLLGHADQKVRLRAQWVLADPKRNAMELLVGVATTSENQLARVHAIWAIGQIGRHDISAQEVLRKCLQFTDPELRAQAAKVIGDVCYRSGSFGVHDTTPISIFGTVTDLKKLLTNDPSPRVKFFAAQSLGKLKHAPAVPALFQVLAENKDADPWLRHACVAALAKIGDADAVNAKAADASPSVRLAVVLVQRRLGDRRVSQFLADADPLVRAEAARAVHDLPMTDRYPELAKQLPGLGLTPAADQDALARRCIDAAFVLGGADEAKAVLAAAGNPHFSAAVRAEAVSALSDWADPPQRDRVIGFWRPMAKRDPAVVRAVVEAGLPKLLAGTSGPLQTAAVGLIGKLGLKADESTFAEWVADGTRDVPARVAALRVLADRKAKALPGSVSVALADPAPLLRAEARDVLAAADPAKAADLLAAVLADDSAPVAERQRAVAVLPKVKTPAAGEQLDAWAAKLAAGGVRPELQLDVLDAVRSAPSKSRDAARGKFEAALPGGANSRYAVSLTGGDAERGREVFAGHAAAQCVRCHVVNGAGGAAGPDLSKVAGRYPEKTREHFLESLLAPSAKIAPGFGTVTLTLADGRTLTGLVLAEDAKTLTVQPPEGKKETVPVADIDKRSAPSSAMPAMDKTLTPREVRDVIEYLTTLK